MADITSTGIGQKSLQIGTCEDSSGVLLIPVNTFGSIVVVGLIY